MVNFGPLASEICWRVLGTRANFNGFHVLAALLHGTLVVGVSQTLGVEQRAARVGLFGRAAITFGTGPHSSLEIFSLLNINCEVTTKTAATSMTNAKVTYKLSALQRV